MMLNSPSTQSGLSSKASSITTFQTINDSSAPQKLIPSNPQECAVAKNGSSEAKSAISESEVQVFPFDTNVNKIILLDRRSSSPWTEYGAPSTPFFDAGDYDSLLQLMGPTPEWKWEDLVPQQFDVDKGYLFAENYLHFLWGFSVHSPIHKQYCVRSPEGFRACFIGTAEQINKITIRIQNQFGAAFEVCLTDDTKRELCSLILNRVTIENHIFTVFTARAEPLYWFARENHLTVKAIKGDFEPLVVFYMASKVSDNDIWAKVLSIIARQLNTHEDYVTVREIVSRYATRELHLPRQIGAFIGRLVQLKLFVKYDQNNRRVSKSSPPSNRSFRSSSGGPMPGKKRGQDEEDVGQGQYKRKSVTFDWRTYKAVSKAKKVTNDLSSKSQQYVKLEDKLHMK